MSRLVPKVFKKAHVPSPSGGGSETLITLQAALTILKESVDGIPFPGLKASLAGLLSVVTAIRNVQGNRDAIEDLIRALDRIRLSITEPLRENASQNSGTITQSLSDRVDSLAGSIDLIATRCNNHLSQGRIRRFFHNIDDANVIQGMNRELDRAIQTYLTAAATHMDIRIDSVHREITTGFGRLDDNLTMTKEFAESGLGTLKKSNHSLCHVEVAQVPLSVQLDQIKELPRADARHDSGSRNNAARCFQGTREKTLEEIYKWIEHVDPNHPPIFWLCGLAGIGKSTIAQTVAEHEDDLHRLGASFFFSRDETDRRNSLLLFPTLAFQMALFNPEYRTHVVSALDNNPDVGRSVIRQQIEQLIIRPLQECGSRINTQFIVIIIDALDECFPESGAEEILILWAAEIRKLNRQVRLLITSRPELHIRSKFQSPALRFISQSYILHDIEKSIVQADVDLFLRHRLNDVAREFGLTTPWPTPYELGVLVKRADVLFIYAATVIKFVADKHWADPHRQLRVLLREKHINETHTHTSRYGEVDALYLQVLHHALSEDHDDELSLRFKNVVGSIVFLQDPMTSGSLESLLQLELGTVRRCLLRLHSVILVPDAEDSLIRVFHPSFPDFLTSPQRCTSERFFVSAAQGHAKLAVHCLQVLKKLLTRDICALLSSGNTELGSKLVPDVAEPPLVVFPPHLHYACIYFAAHISYASSSDTSLVFLVESFCKSKMLVWFEVLSLLRRFDDAASQLRVVGKWYSQTPDPSSLVQQLLYDGVRFSVRFLEGIREGPNHIYSTGLPFSPSCALKDQYGDEADLSFVIQSPSTWDPCMCVIDPGNLEVGPIAFSPDGHFLVSGSRSGVVNIWNATSGGELRAIETNHGNVTTVAVAPDGDRLCSGSSDGAIFIWDTSTGVLLQEFRHTTAISSALFSDDVHLIAGDDWGVCSIWDSISGKLQSTYTADAGNKWREMLIALSSDGSLIALNSSKTDIHLWEWRSGQLKGCLVGHTDTVIGLAFLSVNRQLLSGSFHGKVILWDIADQSMLKTFELECNVARVTTLVVSPNCMSMAWAAQSTIIVQDVRNFHQTHFLKGHNLEVRKLAFSPDNETLVSTSNDRTLRLWDMVVSTTQHERSMDIAEGWENGGEFGWKILFARNGHRIVQRYQGSALISIRDDLDNTSSVRIQERYPIADLAISLDGNTIVTAVAEGWTPNYHCKTKKIHMWDAVQFRLLFEETTMPEGVGDEGEFIGQIALSADGSLIASDHVSGNQLWVWKTGDKSMERIFQFPGQVVSFAFSNNAKKLISFTFEMELCVWDVCDGSLIISASPEELRHPRLIFSSEDDSILCIEDSSCLILDATTLQLKDELDIGPTIGCGQSEDGTALRLLQIRDEWLWEIDCAWERRLCWLPPECRLPDLHPQMAWQGPYLALTISNGDIVILDIDQLRERTPIPMDTGDHDFSSLEHYSDAMSGTGTIEDNNDDIEY